MKLSRLLAYTGLTTLCCAAGCAGYEMHQMGQMLTGYHSKMMAAHIYIQKQSAEEYKLPWLLRYQINPNTQEISIRLFGGLCKQTTKYRNGIGTTLECKNEECDSLDRASDQVTTFRNGIVNHEMQVSNKYSLHDPVQTHAFKDSHKTHALVVIYKNQLVYERYAANISANTPLLGWSISKSIWNALCGILIDENRISLHHRASQNHPPVLVRHLLEHSSGLRFYENRFFPWDVAQMLFLSKSAGKYADSLSLIRFPGTVFSYASGNTNILCKFIKSKLKDEYFLFPYKRLFQPLGMSSAILELDASANFVGSSFIYATARDYAKFGCLYLNKGKLANGEQLISTDWVEKSLQPNVVSNKYGLGFWLNSDCHYPDCPKDMAVALGVYNQCIAIVPSKEIVIVRLGKSESTDFDLNALVSNVIDSLEPNTNSNSSSGFKDLKDLKDPAILR